MQVVSKLNYLRISPRKVRLAAGLIKGKEVKEAKKILNFTNKRAVLPLLKLLNSALNNAKNNFQMETENLYISKISVDEGPKYKRWRPRARGAAYQIQKKTSHITMILEEKTKKSKKKVKKTKKTKPEIITEKGKTLQEIKKEMGAKEEISDKRKEGFSRETQRPGREKGIKRFFRRKSF